MRIGLVSAVIVAGILVVLQSRYVNSLGVSPLLLLIGIAIVLIVLTRGSEGGDN